MTGTHTQNPIYSRITMALMEDTGWYLPNYELADELKWGSQLGKNIFILFYPVGTKHWCVGRDLMKIQTTSNGLTYLSWHKFGPRVPRSPSSQPADPIKNFFI